MATLSLITWRVPLGNRFWSFRDFSLSKRGAKLKSDLPKSKSLGFCFLGFRLSVFSSSVCAPEENRDVDFDTFSETPLPFLFSTRLQPPTMREKLSKMCQKTVQPVEKLLAELF
jgi:hypothetical protein